MNRPRFQIVHYVPNLFLGGRVPVAAIVHHTDSNHKVLVRADFRPDVQCLGGHAHLVALNHALTRIEKEPHRASSAVLGPHIQVDELRPVPHGVDAAPWLREQVLPRPVAADVVRGPKRATFGYDWLREQGIARFVHKRFRPDNANVPKVPQLEHKNLKTISHWAASSTQLLLLEPIIPDDSQQDVIENVATTFGAYRFHLRDVASVTLAAYMLPGGSDYARDYTRHSLAATAHRVYDTKYDSQRADLITQIKKLADGALLPGSR